MTSSSSEFDHAATSSVDTCFFRPFCGIGEAVNTEAAISEEVSSTCDSSFNSGDLGEFFVFTCVCGDLDAFGLVSVKA